MGKVIRGFARHTHTVYIGRQGAVAYKRNDFFAEKQHGYVKGVVKDVVHDSGRGAPVAKIQLFRDSYRLFKQKINTLVCAPEGLHSGQFVFAGKKGK